jgi:N-methylhydantoinase B
MGGGGGARSFADGIDSGGIFHSVSSSLQNVETNESRMPILQLYRKERQDSGGPGRFRGGVGIESAIVPHKGIQPLGVIITASGVSQPEGHGLSGGSPGVSKSNAILRGSNILELLASGVVPNSMEEIAAGKIDYCEAKDRTTLADRDVIVYVISGGGGFGDPIRRETKSVLDDVEQGLVSKEIAASVYGVVVDRGVVDEPATRAARAAIVAERLRQARPAVGDSRREIVAGGTAMHPVSDTVEMVDLDGRIVQRCGICHCKLSEGGEDHLHGALVRELPLTAISPLNAHARLDLFAFRQYVCPGCGTLLAMHVQRHAETMLDESRFPSLPVHRRVPGP